MGATFRSKREYGKTNTAKSWLEEMEAREVNNYRVIAKSGTRWRLYQSVATGAYFACVYLWYSYKNEIGYKNYSHDEHPYHYDCPIAWLDRLKMDSEHAKNWAAKVREYHNRVTQGYTAGMRIRLDYVIPQSVYKSFEEMEKHTHETTVNGVYGVVIELRKPSQLIYRCEKSGNVYRLNPKKDPFTVL